MANPVQFPSPDKESGYEITDPDDFENAVVTSLSKDTFLW